MYFRIDFARPGQRAFTRMTTVASSQAVISNSSPLSAAVAGALAAEAARGAALRRNDPQALAAVLSDDLHYVHSNGKQERKADTLAALAEGRSAYRRFETTDLRAVDLHNGVVLLSGRIDQHKLGSGKWAEQQLLFFAVWRCEDAQWRLVGLQTAQPPAAAPATAV